MHGSWNIYIYILAVICIGHGSSAVCIMAVILVG